MRTIDAVSSGRRRVLLAGVVACLGAGAPAEPAGAEVGAGAFPTSQAVAADAQFLEYAPPPAHPGVVCLVDSGVDPNPDINGAVVGAEAEIASWGTADGLAQVQPPVEGHPAGHGTEMAMIMAAPENGWGMVGIAPTSVRVYSIRVVPTGQTTFPFTAYSYALTRCLKLHFTNTAVSVANLSLSGTATPTSGALADLADSVDTTRQHGVDVVAAAGNNGGTGTAYPANYQSVLSVGAGDAASSSAGVLCDFSNRQALDVISPGCNTASGGIDQAFEDDGAPALGFGTSQAAALTSAVLASMRAYAPTLTVAQAEQCIIESLKNGGNLDAAAAFNACGLAAIVQAGMAAMPSTSANALDPPLVSPPIGVSRPSTAPPRPAVSHVPAPRLGRLSVRGGLLTVVVLNRPAGASVEVRALVERRKHWVVLSTRHSSLSSVTLRAGRATAVEVRFVLVGRRVSRSRWILKAIT